MMWSPARLSEAIISFLGIPSQTQPAQSQQTIQSQANNLLQQAPVIPPKPTQANPKSTSTYNVTPSSPASIGGVGGIGSIPSQRFTGSIASSM